MIHWHLLKLNLCTSVRYVCQRSSYIRLTHQIVLMKHIYNIIYIPIFGHEYDQCRIMLFGIDMTVGVLHDDVIKWRNFPRYWPFVRGFGVFFYLRLNKRLSKQSRGWWFETLSRPLWRHCTVNVEGKGKFLVHGTELMMTWCQKLWFRSELTTNLIYLANLFINPNEIRVCGFKIKVLQSTYPFDDIPFVMNI